MLSFFAGAFAIAGLAAATGPVIIHLLNRRRYRVVHWAAMDFLREALERHRRVLRIRDVLLLILRTLCVLAFGLAMARPYFSRSSGATDPDQPVHAVLVIDNSLSMSYERLSGSVLDEAKTRARQLVEQLPEGSWFSVLPLCGSRPGLSRDAYRTREDAVEAIEAIEVVDREGTAAQLADLAAEACRQVRDVPLKRVIFLGDQQQSCWPAGSLEDLLGKLPDLEIIQVGGGERENAWVSDFRLRDAIADLETPAVFSATIRYSGPAARSNVQVTFAVDETPVASRTVDLEPGQAFEVLFSQRLAVPVEAGRPSLLRASVSIDADRLPLDDRRFLVVPVVASLPVLFIDQHGREEDPRKSRYGETYPLRRLLTPLTDPDADGRQPVRPRHARMEELERDLLQDVSVVAIAGVEAPQPHAVALLREFVERGGQLLIAAGAAFDPAAWAAAAWLDGMGILPLPLEPKLTGTLPEEADGELSPFFLDFASLTGEYFLLEGVSRDELEDLYRMPLFFAAVRALPDGGERKPEARILASFTNGLPFLVERDLGHGRVTFLSSRIQSSWSTLARTHAVVALDRILRFSLERSLPRRNHDCQEEILLPIDPSERRARFTLTRPGGQEEPLSADALAADAYGVSIRGVTRRGFYRVDARREEAAGKEEQVKLWEVWLAANGPAGESELEPVLEAALEERLGSMPHRWIRPDEPIPLEGAQVRGEGIWKWIMATVLLLLVVEVGVLAWPALDSRSRSPA